jgi:hypothetical protein
VKKPDVGETTGKPDTGILAQKFVSFRPETLRRCTEQFEARGFTVKSDPFLLARGYLLAASHPNGEGVLLTPQDVNLCAHQGIEILLDPFQSNDPKPRWQCHDTNRLRKYAEATLSRLVVEVATAPDGARNQTLNKAAFVLGGLLGWEVVDPHAVLGALVNAALDSGLTEGEARVTATKALARGAENPREKPQDNQSLGQGLGFRSNSSNLNISHTGLDKTGFRVLVNTPLDINESLGQTPVTKRLGVKHAPR